MLGILWSFPPLDFFLPLAFLLSSAFFTLSNISFNLCSSARAFFNCKAMSLEFFGLVVSSVGEDASDEEVLGLLFLFFLVLGAVLEVTAFGVVDLEMSDAVNLEPVLLLGNLSVDLGEGDLVGDLDLGLFKDFEILFLMSCGFLVLDFLLPLLLDLGCLHGRQWIGSLKTEKERWVFVIALVTRV